MSKKNFRKLWKHGVFAHILSKEAPITKTSDGTMYGLDEHGCLRRVGVDKKGAELQKRPLNYKPGRAESTRKNGGKIAEGTG